MLYPLSHKGIKNSPRGSTSEGLGPVAGAGSLGGWAKGALRWGLLGPTPRGAVAYAHGSDRSVGAVLLSWFRSRERAEWKVLKPREGCPRARRRRAHRGNVPRSRPSLTEVTA